MLSKNTCIIKESKEKDKVVQKIIKFNFIFGFFSYTGWGIGAILDQTRNILILLLIFIWSVLLYCVTNYVSNGSWELLIGNAMHLTLNEVVLREEESAHLIIITLCSLTSWHCLFFPFVLQHGNDKVTFQNTYSLSPCPLSPSPSPSLSTPNKSITQTLIRKRTTT